MNNRLVPWFAQRWNHFWFSPTLPVNLAVCRIIFFIGLLLVYPNKYASNPDVIYLTHWGDLPEYFWTPIPLFRWLNLPHLPYENLVILKWIFDVGLFFSCIGFLTRLSTVAVFITGFYLWGLPQNFGQIYHTENLPVVIFGIMAIARSGDALSVDNLIRRWMMRRKGEKLAFVPSGEYQWPVKLVWVTFVFAFVAAGVSKLVIGGWAWLVSDQMKWHILEHYYGEFFVPTNLGMWFAQHVWLCIILSWLSVASEFLAPLALLKPLLRYIMAGSWFLLQLGIYILMGVGFSLWGICYVFWVPWDRVLGAFGMKFEGAAA